MSFREKLLIFYGQLINITDQSLIYSGTNNAYLNIQKKLSNGSAWFFLGFIDIW